MSAQFCLRRFVVYCHARSVCDLRFHRGINVIRGDNGVGKSTITDLIVYGMGAEIIDWTEEQLRCDTVYLEVEIRSAVYTIRRDITNTGKAPISFAEKPFDVASHDSTDWIIFPNRRSAERRSYSEELFMILGLPQHSTEDAHNLTMHQILRLMYIDQMTEPSELLNHEIFDPSPVRRAIGEYLLGIDDLETHGARQRLRLSEKEFDGIEAELRAIYKILGGRADTLNRQKLLDSISAIEQEIAELEGRLSSLDTIDEEQLDDDVSASLDEVNRELEGLASKKVELVEDKNSIKEEKLDTILFVSAVGTRLEAIERSKTIVEALTATEFKFCPSCLTPIQEESRDGNCSLCKSELDPHDPTDGHLRAIAELNFQKRESESLLQLFDDKLQGIDTELREIEYEQRSYRSRFKAIERSGSTNIAMSNQTNREIGFNQSRIIAVAEQLEQIDGVSLLQERKQDLSKEISERADEVARLEASTAVRAEDVYSQIEYVAKDLLRGDGGYEDAFNDPHNVSFDFAKNSMSVNGIRRFSASSTVIMKNAIRIAIFLQCIEDQLSRFPTLLLIDNMEDKGMMPARSQNFQKVIVDRCGELTTAFQLIFTTSMVAPELRDSEFVVGPYYKKGTHTLNL